MNDIKIMASEPFQPKFDRELSEELKKLAYTLNMAFPDFLKGRVLISEFKRMTEDAKEMKYIRVTPLDRPGPSRVYQIQPDGIIVEYFDSDSCNSRTWQTGRLFDMLVHGCACPFAEYEKKL